MTKKRRKAIIRRRIFIALLIVFIVAVIAAISLITSAIINGGKGFSNNTSSDTPLQSKPAANSSVLVTDSSTEPASSDPVNSEPNNVTTDDITLDADFNRLLLVNGNNALPEDFDSKVSNDLTTLEEKYLINVGNNRIHKELYPYITAMVEAAWADGVDLKVLSPFRSYSRQSYLFEQQVSRENGDEAKAATVVARPGTSEHNTGLCADFNSVEEEFENTPMYDWMSKNAENYGFILRYPKGKEDITGVIYEPWHWRFVGINAAKEINSLGFTLEEYISYKNLDPTVDMYSDDK